MFGRKLEEILCKLTPLVDQGKVAGFFLNVENLEKLGGLVEDVQEAIVEYQVCPFAQLTLAASEACIRPHYNKTSMTRGVCSLCVSPLPFILMG